MDLDPTKKDLDLELDPFQYLDLDLDLDPFFRKDLGSDLDPILLDLTQHIIGDNLFPFMSPFF